MKYIHENLLSSYGTSTHGSLHLILSRGEIANYQRRKLKSIGNDRLPALKDLLVNEGKERPESWSKWNKKSGSFLKQKFEDTHNRYNHYRAACKGSRKNLSKTILVKVCGSAWKGGPNS